MVSATYFSYLSSLHGKHVIASNLSYQLGNWIPVMYFCDKGFYLTNRELLLGFHNLKVTDVSLPIRYANDHVNIKKMRRDNRAGISKDRDCICWNRNSGGGAINLAVHFGVKRILLLGYDMKSQKNGQPRWHVGQRNYSVATGDRTYERFLRMYPFIARHAKERGVEILNVTDDSALDVFPKVSLKDVS